MLKKLLVRTLSCLVEKFRSSKLQVIQHAVSDIQRRSQRAIRTMTTSTAIHSKSLSVTDFQKVKQRCGEFFQAANRFQL